MFEILCTSAFQQNSLHPSISPWHRWRWGNWKLCSSSVSFQPTGMSTGKENKQCPVIQQPSIHPGGGCGWVGDHGTMPLTAAPWNDFAWNELGYFLADITWPLPFFRCRGGGSKEGRGFYPSLAGLESLGIWRWCPGEPGPSQISPGCRTRSQAMVLSPDQGAQTKKIK